MSRLQTATALPDQLRRLQSDLAIVADAWLDMGAVEVAVVHGPHRTSIAGTPDTGGVVSMRAPLPIPKLDAELEVIGVSPGQSAHLFSDAELLGRLATRDEELEQLTDAVVATNDHVVALHDLATTTVPASDRVTLCNLIADEGLRITTAAALAIDGCTEQPVAVGAHELREELGLLARHPTDGIAVLRPDETACGRSVVVASIPGAGGGVAIAAHRGQHFPQATADLLGALALRIAAHCDLSDRMARSCDVQAEALGSRLSSQLDCLSNRSLPQPPAATIATIDRLLSTGNGDHVVGLPTPQGARIVFGTTEHDGLDAALGGVQRAMGALEALAGGRSTPDALLERLLRDTRRSLDGSTSPDVSAATAVVDWDAGRGTASVATTGGLSLFAREAGRVREVPATHTLMGGVADRREPTHCLRLAPGDAVALISQRVLDERNTCGDTLGPAAVMKCLAATDRRPAADVATQLATMLARHHAGQRVPVHQRGLVLVADDG